VGVLVPQEAKVDSDLFKHPSCAQSWLPKRQRLIADGSPLDLQRRAGAGALDVLQVPVLAL
jgi:hypothetical protein